MKFKHESLDILQWKVNEDLVNLANQLTESGTGLTSTDKPQCQPMLEGMLKLKLVWLTLQWSYKMYDIEDVAILEYAANDRFQIFSLNDEDVKELVKQSYANLIEGFDLMNKNVGIAPGIQPLVQHEADQLCQNIKQVLKNRGL